MWFVILCHVHISPSTDSLETEVETTTLNAGTGIKGERYYLGTGFYSEYPDKREVTLIEQ